MAIPVVAMGFAAGAWLLQRAATLPSDAVQGLIAGLALVVCAAAILSRRTSSPPTVLTVPTTPLAAAVPLLLTLFASTLVGYDWAAWRAQLRLASSLPVALEGRDVRVTGRVEGLPVKGEDGTRFLFRVDSVDSPLPAGFAAEAFAARLQLSWSGAYRNFRRDEQGDRRPPRHIATGSDAVGTAPIRQARSSTSGRVPSIEAGQRWSLTVRLKRPRGNANFRGRDVEGAMLQRGIRATGHVRVGAPASDLASTWSTWPFEARASMERTRAKLAARIAAVLGDAAHTGVITALAIGDQGAIAKNDWERFARTGTNHLVAISGLHVGLVAGFAALLGGGVWRYSVYLGVPLPLWMATQRIAACCGMVGAGWFVALAGFGIPAQRAFWMLAAVFAASLLGRAPAPLIVIAWALLLVVAVDPWAVSSAGFWLSFGAVGSIVFSVRSLHQDAQPIDGESPRPVGGPPRNGRARRPSGPLQRRARILWREWQPGLIGAARAQWAVTVALVPASAAWFGQVPVLGPFANAIAIPWVSFLVVPPVLAGVVLPAPLDGWAFLLGHQLMAWLSTILEAFAAPRWALLRLPAPDGVSLAVAVLGIIWWLGPRGLPLQRLSPVLCLPLFLSRPPAVGDGEFRVTMLDIGQGMAALVETRRHRLLYDTGPPVGRSSAGERIIVPYLNMHGIDALDTLVVSHDHDDHYSGADAIMERVAVDRFLASLPRRQPLWATAAHRARRAERCVHGQSWQWDGVVFQVLWPMDPEAGAPPNDMSCVIRVSNGMHALLLAGDIERAPEAALVRMGAGRPPARATGSATQDPTHGTTTRGAPLRADILLVPHHGSATSSSEGFLDAVSPLHAVFQVGYLNRYRHPSVKIVPRYTARGVATYRNDLDGAVRFESHGEVLTIDAFRRTYRRYWMD